MSKDIGLSLAYAIKRKRRAEGGPTLSDRLMSETIIKREPGPEYETRALLGAPNIMSEAAGVEYGKPLAPRNFGEGLELAANIIGGPAARGIGQGIRAFHGSPHKFDKFSLDRIGTGEGAQAYGHGLYFAENEGVARSYKAAGQPSYLGADRIDAAQRLLQESGGDRLAAMNLANERMKGTTKYSEGRLWQDVINNFDHLVGRGPGHMYEVNIRANPEKFLDWDKPVGAQHPEVRDVLHRVGRNPETAIDRVVDDMRGSHFYNALASRSSPRMDPLNIVGIDKPAATNALREAGIPGIRYLDQGSRSAGDGSRNLVLFNDSIIDILKRYGLMGAVVPAGASAMSSEGQAMPERKCGGAVDPAMMLAARVKRATGGNVPGMNVHTGPIVSDVGGRTDKHEMAVPSGSYVIPADLISGLGQGNTNNGMATLSKAFPKSGPYGSTMPKMRARRRRAEGGGIGIGEPTPILAAGGEFVISPDDVADIGGGDIDAGHEILDSWVVQERKKIIDEMKKLPGPARD